MERGNILLKLGKLTDALEDFESLVGGKDLRPILL